MIGEDDERRNGGRRRGDHRRKEIKVIHKKIQGEKIRLAKRRSTTKRETENVPGISQRRRKEIGATHTNVIEVGRKREVEG